MKERTSPLPKVVIFVTIGLAFIVLIICLCILFFTFSPSNETPSQVTDRTSTQTESTLEIIPSATQPVSTADIRLNQTLEEFSLEYDSLTDMQKQDFISSSYGKSIIWEGYVEDVFSEGIVVIDNPTLYGSVYLGGIPIEELKSINKNNFLIFSGIIVKELNINKFFVPFLDDIYISDVKIIDVQQ